jgi:phosphoglycerate dehydrogenase-like enzyme
VTAILDAPVATINLEDTLWVSLLRRSTGDAVSDFTKADAALFLYTVPFDEECLSDMRKVKVVVEFGCGPDLSDFDSPMVRGRILNEIRLLAVLEQ